MAAEYQPRQAICRIPLIPGSKKPLVLRWTSLPVHSPIWEETFKNHPECNIGYRLDNFVVIDCDSPARVEWWLEQGFPTDFKSCGDPTHRSFWYLLPEGERLRTERFADWEIRSGPEVHCVVPPSTHPSGKRYEWFGPPVDEEHLNEIPPAPVEFLEEIGRDQQRYGAAEGWSVVLRGEGRDNWLTSLGGFLRARSMGESAILAHLRMANQLECVPPLPAADVERVAHSVARYGPEVTLTMEDEGPRLISRKPRHGRVIR